MVDTFLRRYDIFTKHQCTEATSLLTLIICFFVLLPMFNLSNHQCTEAMLCHFSDLSLVKSLFFSESPCFILAFTVQRFQVHFVENKEPK